MQKAKTIFMNTNVQVEDKINYRGDMMANLLDGVEEQKEKRNVVYDSDGIIYLSCYKYRDTDNIELMYADFWMRIHSIEAEIWKNYAVDKFVIAITSKKNFRNDLTDKQKADRVAKPENVKTKKQLEAHREATRLKE